MLWPRNKNQAEKYPILSSLVVGIFLLGVAIAIASTLNLGNLNSVAKKQLSRPVTAQLTSYRSGNRRFVYQYTVKDTVYSGWLECYEQCSRHLGDKIIVLIDDKNPSANLALPFNPEVKAIEAQGNLKVSLIIVSTLAFIGTVLLLYTFIKRDRLVSELLS